jgi:Transposase DDE domain
MITISIMLANIMQGVDNTILNVAIEIVTRVAGLLAFNSSRDRWAAERTLAWLNRNRRLAKEFETSIGSATTWIYIAATQLLIRRLTDA